MRVTTGRNSGFLMPLLVLLPSVIFLSVAVPGLAKEPPDLSAHAIKTPGCVRDVAHAILPRDFEVRLPEGDFPGEAPAASSQVLRSPQDGWTTIFSEYMESTFPDTNWTVYWPSGGPYAYWGDWACWAGSSGNESAGCAAHGSQSIGCGQNYHANMNTWMVSEPFSLSDPLITEAELTFQFRLKSEENYDWFKALISTNGEMFYGYEWSGSVQDNITVDLTNVPTLGDVTGESQVWVAFLFQSDGLVQTQEGAQVDDIVVRAFYETPNQVPQVTVSSPNGGESWFAGTRQTITYSATDPDGGPSPLSVSLQYSTNSGGTWVDIASELPNDGTYPWTVPDVSTTQARVRVCVSDGQDETCDSSNSDFTIAQNQIPQVTLSSPNGGELWGAGSQHAIEYSATDPDGGPSSLSIDLRYSTDSGGSWTEIESDLSNTGSYTWTVPDLTNSQVKVLVCASDGQDETCDASNSDFSIIQNDSPNVTLNSPNGGESYLALSTQTITYSANDPDGGPSALTIGLDYSTNNGSNWTQIDDGLDNTGSYSWKVPDVVSSSMRVRARANDGAAESSDMSDFSFAVRRGENTISVGSTSGAEGANVSVDLSLENENDVKGMQVDIQFDHSVANFVTVAPAGRASGMVLNAREISSGQVRILLHYEDDSTLAPGSGVLAELTYLLTGAMDDQTTLTPAGLVLSGPDAEDLSVTGQGGSIEISMPPHAPILDVSVLKNPGRPRSLQIFVSVIEGSGAAPAVAVGQSAVSMTDLGNSVFVGRHSAATSASGVTISASDTNLAGPGNKQITVSFD